MSGDFLAAAGSGGFNTAQYAFLQHAIAQECGLQVGIFMHVIQDLHLYNKHVEQAKILIERSKNTTNKAPKIKIANKPIFELTVDDVEIIDYEHQGGIGKLPIAV